MIQFDDHIFQMSWFNHQVDNYILTGEGIWDMMHQFIRCIATLELVDLCGQLCWTAKTTPNISKYDIRMGLVYIY